MEDPSANTQALPAGTRIEEFMIERVLGSGGFGITYLARDTSLGRQVVIKENLPAQFAWRETTSGTVRPRHTSGGDADDYQWAMNNFLREAETLASLDHPGIVRVLRKFEANGTAYFVMPFVEGVALDELAAQRQGKPFSEQELRGLLERTLSALAYLHERGIYHRDIKPGNILISNEGVPALIDFGSARQMLSERSMTVIESAGYTPFEQLQSKGNVGPWSDLYALGAALEKILTGEAPPKAMDRMRNDPRLPLANSTDLEALYSTAFLASIDKALAVEENQRWQSAEEWLWILRGEIVAKPVATAPKRKQETISARSAEASKPATGSDKKHNFIPWIVGVCVVLGLIAVANLTGEKEASPSPTSVEEATLQQERAKAEAAAAQAREAEQRAAQAEREKEEIIAQARAKEEAETREAERQRAARTAEEEQALIAQARAKEQAAAKAEEAKRLHAGGDAGKERDFEIAPGLTITMCWIPPGEFMMGRAEGEGGRGKDETQHPVTLSQGFWLAKTEVTQAQWRAVMGSNPSHFKGDDLPVESVSWNAIAGPGGFIDKLNKIATADGGRFKLPTEAQWEYACLAGTVGPYDGGLDQMAWYRENSGNRTHTVGQKKANAWGLHDMHGNVWEWCADWNRAYPEGAVRDPSGPDSGSARVRRGGSWGSDAYYCHVAHRSSYHPAMSYDDIGFRIARSSAPQSGMPSEPKTSEDISPNASHTTPGGRKNSSGKPTVCLQTSEGRIVLELNAEKAPISVENFLGYVKTKHYDGTVFHRVIDGFMIQGGGFAVTDGKLVEKSTGKGIKNEGQNGLKNDRGTIAMARTNDPDSATAQFFINVVDNAMLNYPSNGGYAVFGKVIEGMDVVDKIKAVKTGVTKLSMHHPATGEILEIPSQDVPKNIVVIKSATIIE